MAMSGVMRKASGRRRWISPAIASTACSRRGPMSSLRPKAWTTCPLSPLGGFGVGKTQRTNYLLKHRKRPTIPPASSVFPPRIGSSQLSMNIMKWNTWLRRVIFSARQSRCIVPGRTSKYRLLMENISGVNEQLNLFLPAGRDSLSFRLCG